MFSLSHPLDKNSCLFYLILLYVGVGHEDLNFYNIIVCTVFGDTYLYSGGKLQYV